MDYESFDKAAVEYLASALDGKGHRFYLTAEGLGTDILERAHRYRSSGEACEAAREANCAGVWPWKWFLATRVLKGEVR